MPRRRRVAAAAGPPFPDPSTARPSTTTPASSSADDGASRRADRRRDRGQTEAEVVVYTQALGRDDITTEETEAHAAALMDQWGVGRRRHRRRPRHPLRPRHDRSSTARCSCTRGSGFDETYMLDATERQAIFDDDDAAAPARAATSTPRSSSDSSDRSSTATFGGDPRRRPGAARRRRRPPPGPPFPEPETDRAVYDYAGLLSPATIADAEATIDAIEAADRRRGRRLHPGQRRVRRRPRRPRRRRAP